MWRDSTDWVFVGLTIFVVALVCLALLGIGVGFYYGYRYHFGPSVRFAPRVSDGNHTAEVVSTRLAADSKPLDGASVTLKIDGKLYNAVLRYNPQFRPFICTASVGSVCEITVKNNDLVSFRWK